MNNPQKPNPDQLEHISPRNDPRNNPARYEEPPADALKPPVPTIPIGPNAVYLVDPGFSETKEKTENGGGNQPAPADESPVLTSLTPNELPVWAQDTEVFWNGSNFTEASVIIWNNGEEATKFISATQLSTIVKPSTVQVPPPYSLQTSVKTGDKESAKLDFTFIS